MAAVAAGAAGRVVPGADQADAPVRHRLHDRQPLEPETLLQLYILLAAIADPVRKLSSVFTRLQSGWRRRTASSSTSTAPRRANTDGPRCAPTGCRAGRERPAAARRADYIEFRDVCFSYEPGQPILTNINLQVRAGETIALVGPERLRQDDPPGPAAALLRPGPRPRPDRRHRPARGQPAEPAAADRPGDAGARSCSTTRSTTTSPTATAARRPEQVEEAARRAHAHDFIVELPRGLRDARRRGRRRAVRRPEAAARPGPGHPARPEHPDPRRVHQPDRRRERGGHPPRAARVQAGPRRRSSSRTG